MLLKSSRLSRLPRFPMFLDYLRFPGFPGYPRYIYIYMVSKEQIRSIVPGHAGQENWHRGHFGPGYKSGALLRSKPFRRGDRLWQAHTFWNQQHMRTQEIFILLRPSGSTKAQVTLKQLEM
jgi:hypothetical protein